MPIFSIDLDVKFVFRQIYIDNLPKHFHVAFNI